MSFLAIETPSGANAVGVTSVGATAGGSMAQLSDFFALLKPRVMSLVVFSGLTGLLIAPTSLHPIIAMVAVLCIAIGSGAAGALNMWWERELDAKMERTRRRPLPTGRISPEAALEFGCVMAVGSVLLMGLAVNFLAALLLAAAILFYVFVYTIWLKPRTPQNIVIGGAAGAFPPVIGWAAATGEIGLPALLLFLIIFFWTPPHFWALALYRHDDYLRAGIPMMPVVAGKKSTQWQMLAYTILLLPLGMSLSFIGFAGPLYLYTSLALGLLFILHALAVILEQTDASAMRMFRFSLLHLSCLLLVLIFDRLSSGLFA